MDKANINEPLIERNIREIDLPEATRRNDVFTELGRIKVALDNISVFPSLLWVWVYDVMADIYQNEYYDLLTEKDYVDEAVPTGITLKQIFDQFWEDVDGLGLTMDSGGEIIEEVVRDWMRDNDFLISIEDLEGDND